MHRFPLSKLLSVCLICGMSAFAAPEGVNDSPWRIRAGVSIGSLIPMSPVVELGYKAIYAHVEGFGSRAGKNDFWSGARGGVGWTFFWNLPFSFEVGVNGGYEFAEAPNKMHQAVNDANGAIILYPYNFVETADISAEARVHLYGFFTQVGYPIYHFMDHDAPTINWRAGYLVEF